MRVSVRCCGSTINVSEVMNLRKLAQARPTMPCIPLVVTLTLTLAFNPNPNPNSNLYPVYIAVIRVEQSLGLGPVVDNNGFSLFTAVSWQSASGQAWHPADTGDRRPHTASRQAWHPADTGDRRPHTASRQAWHPADTSDRRPHTASRQAWHPADTSDRRTACGHSRLFFLTHVLFRVQLGAWFACNPRPASVTL